MHQLIVTPVKYGMFWCWADRNLQNPRFDIWYDYQNYIFWQCSVSYRGIKAGWCLKSHVTLEQGFAETATVRTQTAEEACWMTEKSYSDSSEDYNLRDGRPESISRGWDARKQRKPWVIQRHGPFLKRDTVYCQQQQRATATKCSG